MILESAPVTTPAVLNRGKQPLFVSYGAGVDSTAMLVGLHHAGVKPDGILFADTGSEKDLTYRFLREIMEPWTRSVGFPDITVVRYRQVYPDRSQYGTFETLEQECLAKGMLPSIAYYYKRGCSQKWKHEPMDKYVAAQEVSKACWAADHRVIRAIGYDAGKEDARRGWNVPENDWYRYWYPLREWGWDREACKQAILAAGLPVPPKSACFFCSVTKPEEIDWMAEHEPDKLVRIVQMEKTAAPNLDSIKGLWVKERMTDYITALKGRKKRKAG